MFIKVTRSQAVTALLEGKDVFCGDTRDLSTAVGHQLDRPELYSRRQAAAVLTRFFYNDDLCARHAHAGYWVHIGEWAT